MKFKKVETETVTTETIKTDSVETKFIVINGQRFAPRTIRYVDANGREHTETVLLTQDR